MKRILLTGANGFIGKKFIKRYNSKYNIIEVTKKSKYRILDLESLNKIENIDIVLHFAAKTFVPDSFDNPYEFYKFNMESTLNIAEFCRTKKVKKLIYLNSYTYGNPQYLPIDEKHPLAFHSPYNKSKYLAENLLINYLENITNVVSLRLFNIYGPNQDDNFLIPTILKQIEGNNINVKDLEPKRDYLYIEDLLNLLDLIIKKDSLNGVFNVGSGKSYSVKEIIDTVLNILDTNLKIESQNLRRENEVMDCVADIKKLTNQLDWLPNYSLIDGLKDYIKREIKNV